MPVTANKGRTTTGWVITGLIAAFMLFDAAGKLAKPAQVVDAFARTGWPIQLATTVGAILLICAVVYLIPQTSLLSAILLIGCLDFGVLVWVGLWLREPRVESVFHMLK